MVRKTSLTAETGTVDPLIGTAYDVVKVVSDNISVVSAVAARLPGIGEELLTLQGLYDASTDTYPTSPTIGDFWVLSVGGTLGSDVLVPSDSIVYTASGWHNLFTSKPPVTDVQGRTGNVVLTKADVGLGNADDTSDANKPVSTAQQTALDLKADLTGATFTGPIVTSSTVDGRDVSVDGAKLDAIEANAKDDQTGAEIKSLYQAEVNAFTDALFTKLSGIETNAKDDQTAVEIQSLYEGLADVNRLTDALLTKLNGIETAATADQTGVEIKTAYEANADTNVFSDAQVTKLAGIETSATADQTGAEIKAAYEAEANTNAFTDADQSKLGAIEAGATADQSDAEIKTAYENNADTNAFTDADKAAVDAINATATAKAIAFAIALG